MDYQTNVDQLKHQLLTLPVTFGMLENIWSRLPEYRNMRMNCKGYYLTAIFEHDRCALRVRVPWKDSDKEFMIDYAGKEESACIILERLIISLIPDDIAVLLPLSRF